MPYIVIPRNNKSCLQFLETCEMSIVEDEQNGESVLSQKTANSVKKLRVELNDVLSSYEKSATVRAFEVEEKGTALNRAEMFLHDYWRAAKNRARRNNYPAAVLKFYGLPLSGLIPNTNPTASLFPLLDTAIKGDADAVEAGYPAMSNPSVEEMIQVAGEARKELSDVSKADKIVDAVGSDLAKKRKTVDKLIKDVIAELRFVLRDEDEASQRRIMRKYGVIFRSEQEETQV